MTTTPGQRIRDLREELGWSQDTLARAANMSVDYLLQLEDGRATDVSIRTWRKLAEALGYTEDDILSPKAPSKDIYEEIPSSCRFVSRLIVRLIFLLGALSLIALLIFSLSFLLRFLHLS